MHIHFLDPYQPRQSPIHALDGRVKFVLALGFILTTSLLRASLTLPAQPGEWLKYALLFLLLALTARRARLGVGYVLKRSSLALPFVLAALPLLFARPRLGIDIPLFALGRWGIYAEGLGRFLELTLKSWLAVQAAILLVATTPFPDLLQAMRAVGMPRLLVALFGLTWRYLFVLADEALRLMRARAARAGEAVTSDGAAPSRLRGWRRLRLEAQVTGGMAASLLLRAFARADRIYFAMLARGYDGEMRSLPLPRLSHSQQLWLFGGLILFLILLLS